MLKFNPARITGRILKKRSHKTGMAPGSLVYSGEAKEEAAKITLIDYDVQRLEEKIVDSVEDIFPHRDTETVSWINIDGVHDVHMIEKLGDHFGIHPLVLEDIVHTSQRPKLEDFDDYLFLVFRMLYYDEEKRELQSEQVSVVLGPTYVISFQELEGDVLHPVRDRIRNAVGRIRKKGPDYLAYALIDVVIDHYFIVLETMSTQTEELESQLLEDPGRELMHEIAMLRRELILLRKAVWPVRDLLSDMGKSESKLVRKDTRPFVRDAYDHTIQVIEIVESLRDLISVLRDSYQSIIGNRMNEIMKVLTIIATIFIPLTFIAGIYGMNFDNMPELHWQDGYFYALGAMGVIGLGLALYFWWKKWI
jgi:magnesium transporter